MFENNVLKAAYDKAIERMKTDKKVSTLKAGRAAEAVTDKKAGRKLQQIQEDRLSALGGIDGDWLVLGDRSGSMRHSIELVKEIASVIVQQVKGQVHLVFFDTHPTYYDVSGKTLEEIKQITRYVDTGGMTSIGCGLEHLLDEETLVNGIAICSDGGENHAPRFPTVYKKYAARVGVDPPVYLYHVDGESDHLTPACQREDILIEKFECDGVDYYSLPNLVKTMRTSRYALVDEIMEMPLLTFNQVFKQKGE